MLKFHNGGDRIENEEFQSLHKLMLEMDGIVQHSANKAYNLSSLDMGRNRQKQWSEAVRISRKSGNTGFLRAAYGYAVEDIANSIILRDYQGSAYGYTIELQVNYGSTIPDIVIRDGSRQDVAWLDITSAGSEGHIFNKQSGRWSTTPFVAELLYPTFNYTNLRVSDTGYIAARAESLHLSRSWETHERKMSEFSNEVIERVLSRFSSFFPESKAEVAAAFEEETGAEFPWGEKHTAIKPMLKNYVKAKENAQNEYPSIAKGILHAFYRNGGENISHARAFTAAGLRRRQERNQIYASFSNEDSNDDFL